MGVGIDPPLLPGSLVLRHVHRPTIAPPRTAAGRLCVPGIVIRTGV